MNSQKAADMHVTQRGLDTEEQVTDPWHSYSADEGIAELDGPFSVSSLLEQLKEKDERIQVLGDKLLRVSM